MARSLCRFHVQFVRALRRDFIMPYVPMIDYDKAPDNVKKAHDEHLKIGRMTNMKKTLLNSVPAFNALMEWYTLRDEAAKFLSSLDISLFCHAISEENQCLICSTFFRKILKDEGVNIETFSLTELQELLIGFGKGLINNPGEIGDELFAELKRFFNDEQIVLLTAFGAIMIATNLINTTLHVKLDGYLLGVR